MKKIKIIFILVVFVLIFFGVFYIYSGWKDSYEKSSETFLKNARIAEAALPKDVIGKLDKNLSDLEKKEYQDLKRNLKDLVEADGAIRFAYIYIEREEKIFFAVDSEDPWSGDYSPPGQEYTEANEQMFAPFRTGEFLITNPVADRWGNWVSALVPIRDSLTGEVVAVFGMDYPVEKRNAQLQAAVTGRIGMVFGICVLLVGFYWIISYNYRIKEVSNKFDKIFERNPSLMAISSLEEGKFTDVNQVFLEKLGFLENEVLGKKSADLKIFVQPEKQKKVAEELKKNGFIHDVELQIKTKSGEILEGLFSGEVIENEGKKYLLTVMLDQTERKKAENKLSVHLEETEKINKLMIGREIKMIELKKELEILKNKNQ